MQYPTGEILIYQNKNGNIKIDVRLEEETVWLTQAQLCELFQKSKATVSEHIKNVFEEAELDSTATVRKFRTVQQEGGRTVERELEHYNLDVIISVGYRVKSPQGTQFRIWATQRLKEYIIKGFALNDDRFKSGTSMNYFNELQERIREIRLSERFFYQKIKDIYTTSIDYDPKDEKTLAFFKVVQNKLLWAISEQTAAELVYRRVDATLPLLGMQSHDKKNLTSVRKSDISVAKNYLTEDEDPTIIGDGGAKGDLAEGPCFMGTPTTELQLLNRCTDAEKIERGTHIPATTWDGQLPLPYEK